MVAVEFIVFKNITTSNAKITNNEAKIKYPKPTWWHDLFFSDQSLYTAERVSGLFRLPSREGEFLSNLVIVAL